MKFNFKSNQPIKKQVETMLVSNTSLPITIFYEKRNGYRCSFTKKGLNVRIPNNIPKKKQQEILKYCKQWAEETVLRKPNLLLQYRSKIYRTGHEISLFDETYTIIVHTHDKQTIATKISDNHIAIYIPRAENESIIDSKIISKAFAKHYRSLFENKVTYWNQYFPIKYNTLRLKYNSSNWGSCSSKRNINLSTRLLLCPERVIDYVIVHELAHLIEQNHSKAFWLQVERVLPNYKQERHWLKTQGAHLDF